MMLFVIVSSGLSLYLNQRSQASLNVFMDSGAIADEITQAVDSLAAEVKSVTAKDIGVSESDWQDFLKLEETYGNPRSISKPPPTTPA